MPSSGKSTLGRQLAAALNHIFVDMDELIIQNEGRSVFQIFKESGEQYFREIESKLLRNFEPDQRFVISTGGGVPCFFNNIAFIKQNGISIYLDVTPQILFDRIHISTKNDRPLIDKSDSEKLWINLNEKYNYRYQFYSKADIIITEDFTVGHILSELDKVECH